MLPLPKPVASAIAKLTEHTIGKPYPATLKEMLTVVALYGALLVALLIPIAILAK